jgi:hypothetical protein
MFLCPPFTPLRAWPCPDGCRWRSGPRLECRLHGVAIRLVGLLLADVRSRRHAFAEVSSSRRRWMLAWSSWLHGLPVAASHLAIGLKLKLETRKLNKLPFDSSRLGSTQTPCIMSRTEFQLLSLTNVKLNVPSSSNSPVSYLGC